MTYSVYAFDAYGTLFDVHSAVSKHRDAIGENAARLSEIWRNKQLEYTWVRTLMDAYESFEVLTEQALDFAATQCGGLDPSVRQKLLDAYQTLDAYEDVAPTLQTLRGNGAKTAILSNGTEKMIDNAVSAAGIGELIDTRLSVDPLGKFKTVAEVYSLATEAFGVEPGEVSFQSSNRWDIAGARKFGFRPVWVNRTGQADEYPDLAPKHAISSLAELVTLPN